MYKVKEYRTYVLGLQDLKTHKEINENCTIKT